MAAKAKAKRPGKLISHWEMVPELSISHETFRRMIARGEIPRPLVTIGRQMMYRRSEFNQFLRTGKWPTRAEAEAADAEAH